MKKENQTAEAATATTWRKPIKLPSIMAKNPIEQLYRPTAESQIAAETEPATANEEPTTQISADETAKTDVQTAAQAESTIKPAAKPKKTVSAPQTPKIAKPESKQARPTNNNQRDAAELGQLLRTENLERLYSLQEVLRGTSMILYCILYSESRANGRCQMKAADLMMRSGISNPATLHKQERWLAQLGLVSKSYRLGSHDGAVYEVFDLESLPLPDHVLEQFEGYLVKYAK